MIYFAQAQGTDRVKIGYADDVAVRLAAIVTACPFPLRLVRSIDGSPATERWLHGHFASRRVHREWFLFSEAMLTIEPPRLAVPTAVEFPIVEKLGGRQVVPAKMKAHGHTISPDGVRMWAARGTIPGDAARVLMKIAESERVEYSASDFEPATKNESAA